MAKVIRVGLLGGSESIRSSRRSLLEERNLAQVVLDSDGFGLTVSEVIEYAFDLLIVDHKLPQLSGFEFCRSLLAAAKVANLEIGNVLVSSQFPEDNLRLKAIEVGAIDCIFVVDGSKSFIDSVKKASVVDADYAIRELIHLVDVDVNSKEDFQRAQVALATLDEKETMIMAAFSELKTDAQIAQSVQVPKLKVRNTVIKAQNLLALNTRSQLLMKLKALGQLAL